MSINCDEKKRRGVERTTRIGCLSDGSDAAVALRNVGTSVTSSSAFCNTSNAKTAGTIPPCGFGRATVLVQKKRMSQQHVREQGDTSNGMDLLVSSPVFGS